MTKYTHASTNVRWLLMQDTSGMFFVLEGSDGSGKATQLAMLKGRLEQAGYKVKTFDFPQYSQPSSFFVNKYLGGNYGSAEQVGPYSSSLFFALDRFEAAPEIRKAIQDGFTVIANRFTASNMAYQSTMFNNIEQRRGFYIWLDNLEYVLLNIPRPNLNLYLRVPTEISNKLMADQKIGRFNDINENNPTLLKNSVRSYDELCQLFPKDFKQIDCIRGGELMSVENIHKMIWETIQPYLPEPSKVASGKPLAQIESTASVTTQTAPKAADSVQISTLLACKLGFVHLSNPVPNTHTGTKNQYYAPDSLSGKIRYRYEEVMGSLFELQDEMRSRIKPESAHLLISAMPLAAQNTYVIGHDEFKKIYESNELEAYSAAKSLALDQEMVEKPKLSKIDPNALLANNFDIPSSQPVTLISASPRNELDVVANILYPGANLPFRELKEKIESWPYDQKASVLLAYLAAGNDYAKVLDNIRYSFEINAPFTVLKEFQTLAPSASFVWQKLTPRYGYDIPEEIENSGLADLYERCFDISLELCSELQSAGFTDIAEYTTLQGHNARFNLVANYTQLKSIQSSYEYSTKTAQNITLSITDQLALVHSLLGHMY